MGLFSKAPDPIEKQKALDCLKMWHNTITSIDEATDATRTVIASNPLGSQSDEYEEARLVAVNTVKEAQKNTADLRNWPILSDNDGFKILIELVKDLNESYQHQMNILNLYKAVSQAVRSGDEGAAPSVKEIQRAHESFGRLLDKMGHTAAKLTRHYKISAQEYLNG